ncbi:MAG: hypothetical protein AAF959_22040 [Cyanobacteria bacterium P01_D01_bin.56]
MSEDSTNPFENFTTFKPIDLRSMRSVPHKGEAYVSVLLSNPVANCYQKATLLQVAKAAEVLGVEPELVSLEFKERREIHALFYHLNTDNQDELDSAFKGKFLALKAAGIPSKAIRDVKNSRVKLVVTA